MPRQKSHGWNRTTKTAPISPPHEDRSNQSSTSDDGHDRTSRPTGAEQYSSDERTDDLAKTSHSHPPTGAGGSDRRRIDGRGKRDRSAGAEAHEHTDQTDEGRSECD